jgi:L-fucose isomerase, C-terminal domain
MSYLLPSLPKPPALEPKTVYLIASGDSRDSANKTCWAAQRDMEAKLELALSDLGWKLKRAHDYDPILEHGFIWNQRMGMDVFSKIPKNAPLIVAEAVWQFSHHVLAGLRDHQGSILTVANWSGQYPGLVGLLNLGGGLTKMGVPFSSLWSTDFTDAFFKNGLQQFLETGRVVHDLSHVRELEVSKLPQPERELGMALAQQLKLEKAIIGVFDEGCMGMYNAIIDDEMLNPCGIYKERLSQSALVAEMQTVTNFEAQQARDWLDAQGMRFNTGSNPETELTDAQILEQLKMYVAAIRIAHDFSCDAIGIQYQLGLKDMTPASDLVEGLLNNVIRPPVKSRDGLLELFAGKALPHFNEVDEGAAVDALVTNRVWTAMGFDPATTLHDVRWGEEFKGQYVWVFLISGAAPPSHFIGGYAGSSSDRQPAMYFRKGGGTLKGISKPGELVWSRVFVMDGKLHCDIGRASVVELPTAETSRRWELTTPEWPIMHAVLHGVSRDQLMARHKANHIQVAYCPTPQDADKALAAKAAMLEGMGIQVYICGTVGVG